MTGAQKNEVTIELMRRCPWQERDNVKDTKPYERSKNNNDKVDKINRCDQQQSLGC